MIYVDDPMTWNEKFPNYCHMWTDGSIEELHQFADKLGLRREWFQDHPKHPHYDISYGKRKQALKMGAKYISYMDWLKQQKVK